jgi:hypothetical protein
METKRFVSDCSVLQRHIAAVVVVSINQSINGGVNQSINQSINHFAGVATLEASAR